jgi:hypothetical protein
MLAPSSVLAELDRCPPSFSPGHCGPAGFTGTGAGCEADGALLGAIDSLGFRFPATTSRGPTL